MAIGRIPEPGTGIPESIVDAKGDIVTATAADTPARLAVGTNEHRLVAASGETTGLKYVADTTNYAIAAKGDLLVGTAADTLAALSVGTNGYTLVADSSETTGLKWQAPASGGKVLQVVSATYATQFSTSSSTAADTGLTASITPASASNKVLVMVAQQCGKNGSNANTWPVVTLLRGSTVILGEQFIGYTNTQLQQNMMYSVVYLDSPNTTSSTTYKTQLASGGNSAEVNTSTNNKTANIVLLEIGA